MLVLSIDAGIRSLGWVIVDTSTMKVVTGRTRDLLHGGITATLDNVRQATMDYIKKMEKVWSLADTMVLEHTWKRRNKYTQMTAHVNTVLWAWFGPNRTWFVYPTHVAKKYDTVGRSREEKKRLSVEFLLAHHNGSWPEEQIKCGTRRHDVGDAYMNAMYFLTEMQ